ncbi:MAG: InlB B-repeat-containing protein, partial [Clostridiales bacterium]|nr:InlB B-repeat-containing protein [Clostridiales bacterium]
YTAGSDTLTVSGFGTVTFNGKNGIYVINEENPNVIDAIVNETASYAFTLDPENNTFTKETTSVEIELVLGEGNTQTIIGGKNITTKLPANPTAPNDKVFRGWYTQANGQGDKVTEVTPENTDKITYYAFWRNKVTLQYVDNANVTHTLDLGEGDRYSDYLPKYGVEEEKNRYFVSWKLENTNLSIISTVGASDAGKTIQPQWETLPAWYGTYKGVQLNSSGSSVYTLTIDVEGKMVGSDSEYNEAKNAKIKDHVEGDPEQWVPFARNSSGTYYFLYDNTTGIIVIQTDIRAGGNSIVSTPYVLVKGATENPIVAIHRFRYNKGAGVPSNTTFTTYLRVNTKQGVKDVILYDDGQKSNRIFSDVRITDVNGTVFDDEPDSKIVDKIKAAKTLVVKDVSGNVELFRIITSEENFGVNNATILNLQAPYGTYSANGKDIVFDGIGGVTYNGKTGTYSKDAANDYVDIYLAENTEYWRLTIGDTNTMVQPMTTVTFDPQGGTLAGGNTQQFNTNIAVTLPTPTRANFVFRGWFTDSACQNAVELTEEKFIPTEDDTFYAKWVARITITLHYMYTETDTTTDTTEAIVGETVTITNPTHPNGLIFDGWFTNSSYTGNEWKSNDTIVTSDVRNLYAKWTTGHAMTGVYKGIVANCYGDKLALAGATSLQNFTINADGTFSGYISAAYTNATGTIEYNDNGTFTIRIDGQTDTYSGSFSQGVFVIYTATTGGAIIYCNGASTISRAGSGWKVNNEPHKAVSLTIDGVQKNIFINNSAIHVGVTFKAGGEEITADAVKDNVDTLQVIASDGSTVVYGA